MLKSERCVSSNKHVVALGFVPSCLDDFIGSDTLILPLKPTVLISPSLFPPFCSFFSCNLICLSLSHAVLPTFSPLRSSILLSSSLLHSDRSSRKLFLVCQTFLCCGCLFVLGAWGPEPPSLCTLGLEVKLP